MLWQANPYQMNWPSSRQRQWLVVCSLWLKCELNLTQFISTFERFHMKWTNICSQWKTDCMNLLMTIVNKYFIKSLSCKTAKCSLEGINSTVILTGSSKWRQSQVNMDGSSTGCWWMMALQWRSRQRELIERAYLYGRAMVLTGCDVLRPLGWAGK